MDARDGEILWQFECGASVDSSPAIVDGTVLWGCGYRDVWGDSQTTDALFAFQIGKFIFHPKILRILFLFFLSFFFKFIAKRKKNWQQ